MSEDQGDDAFWYYYDGYCDTDFDEEYEDCIKLTGEKSKRVLCKKTSNKVSEKERRRKSRPKKWPKGQVNAPTIDLTDNWGQISPRKIKKERVIKLQLAQSHPNPAVLELLKQNSGVNIYSFKSTAALVSRFIDEVARNIELSDLPFELVNNDEFFEFTEVLQPKQHRIEERHINNIVYALGKDVCREKLQNPIITISVVTNNVITDKLYFFETIDSSELSSIAKYYIEIKRIHIDSYYEAFRCYL